MRTPRHRVLLAVIGAVIVTAATTPAEASYPAQNAKLFFTSGSDIWNVNPDGSAATNVTNSPESEICPVLSPGGLKVAFVRTGPVYGLYAMNPDGSAQTRLNGSYDGLSYELSGCPRAWTPDAAAVTFTYDDHCDGGGVFNAFLDGRDLQQVACGGPICGWDTTPEDPDWSPDGSRVALVGCPFQDQDNRSDLWTVGANGSGFTQLTATHPEIEFGPDFSPDGTQIAYGQSSSAFGTDFEIWKVNRDGTGRTQLAADRAAGPAWSPDGQKILFSRGGDVWTMDPDGSNETNLTSNPASDGSPVWSPDAEQIAFTSTRDGDTDIYVMNRDGSNVVQVTNTAATEGLFGWQSIVKNYPRPKGAGPSRFSLVPAYLPCGSSNRQHGPPLAFPSCNPPAPASPHLTIGSPDANGAAAQFTGYLLTRVLAGNPATPADEADVVLEVSTTDIRCTHTSPPTACGADNVSTFPHTPDYTGELEGVVFVRITDKDNTPNPGGPGAATVEEFDLRFTLPCTETASNTIGSSCSVSTTVDALLPGAVKEGRRAIWELDRVHVRDGGPDGDVATAGNRVFLRSGVYVP